MALPFEEYLADEGDRCDSCDKVLAQDEPFLGQSATRIRWRFCCMGCVTTGVTIYSRKARFIGFVLGESNGIT